MGKCHSATGLKRSVGSGVCNLNLVIRRIGKDLQWAGYVENLNWSRSDDDDTPPIDRRSVLDSLHART